MDIQTLKQRLSLQNIGQTMLRLVKRFPVAVCFLFGLTVLLSYIMCSDEVAHPRINTTLLIFMSGGLLIDFIAALWGEELKDRWRRWVTEGLALVLYGAYSFWICMPDLPINRTLPSFIIANAAWVIAIVCLIPFVSFWHEKNDLKSWHFILYLFLISLISGTVVSFMSWGIEGLVLGTSALFDLESLHNEKLHIVIMIVCCLLLDGLLSLALVPTGERKHNDSPDMPSVMTKIVSWLLLPLLGCYILVLYIYGGSIIVHAELPKGMLSWLVSAVMGGYIFCYLLLYPEICKEGSRLRAIMTKWLPAAILPLLVLMTVGVVRRFMDYGITAPRLYLLTILLWFYAVCIVMLVVKRKRFRWIVLSFTALFVLTSGHPFHYFRICRPILEAKINRMIEEKELQTPFEIYSLEDCTNLTKEEANELKNDINYMQNWYGNSYAERWIEKDITPADTPAEREFIDKKDYHKDYETPYLSPQGFTYFKYKNFHDGSFPADSLYNGVLHVPVRQDKEEYVLLIDTAALATKEPIIVPCRDGKGAFTPSEISIEEYSDGMFVVNIYGNLFTK